MARPRKTPETEMPGGEMVEPPRGRKPVAAKDEMPGADMNVPVAEELAAPSTPARRTASARAKKAPVKRKAPAKKPAARKKTGGSK